MNNSIVPIYTATTNVRNFGTGFVIDKTETSICILTAYHVIEIQGKPCQPSDISTIPLLKDREYSEDNKIKASEVITYNESLDLAIIQFPSTEFDQVGECNPLPLNLFSDYNVEMSTGINFVLSGYYWQGTFKNTPFFWNNTRNNIKCIHYRY